MDIRQSFRNLKGDAFNTAVIVVSLTIGIGAFSLILLFLSRELGTDKFHRDGDRIYALKCEDPWTPGSMIYYCKAGSAEYMKNNFLQVEDYCRIINSNPQKIVAGNEDRFDHPSVISASGSFFRFFSYKLLSGDPDLVLDAPNSIVISSEIAQKYFGSEDPIGKPLILVYSGGPEEKIITGLFEKPVENTQIIFDIICKAGDKDGRCYVKLSEGSTKDEAEDLFKTYKDIIPVINTGTPGSYFLEPLRSAYFDTSRILVIEASRDKTDLLIALTIGLMVFGIAVFNYLGVLSNKYRKRIREIYLRRIHGSSLKGIIFRFTLENYIVILFSFILSIILVTDALPFFNNLTGSNITSTFIFKPSRLIVLLSVLALVMIVTLLFTWLNINPNLNPQMIRNGSGIKTGGRGIPLFNIFQLACSAGLLLCSVVIMKQIIYIDHKQIGLDKGIIEIRIPGQYRNKAVSFRDELLKNNSIENVSITTASPVLEHFLIALKYDDEGIEKQYVPAGFSGDENFLDVLGIEVISGSGFSRDPSANSGKCVVNESLAKMFPGRDLIGRGMPGNENTIVIGIVRDFHFSNLRSAIGPAFIGYDTKGFHLLVKVRSGLTNKALQVIGETWASFIPDFPLNIESVGERFEWYHRDNKNFIRLIGLSAIISIILSLIGLFAVSYQKIRSRTKEIGLRKINGAYSSEVLALIIRDFMLWTAIACIISIPPAWFAMNRWLRNYSYHTELNWWIIVVSQIVIIIISLGTVIFQSWRAATRNPVEALRYE